MPSGSRLRGAGMTMSGRGSLRGRVHRLAGVRLRGRRRARRKGGSRLRDGPARRRRVRGHCGPRARLRRHVLRRGRARQRDVRAGGAGRSPQSSACRCEAALDAYASGFEAMAAVAAASHPALYDAGWHPTAVCGPIGAAVAASRLLGLSQAERDNAIAVALLRAGGTRGAFGSDGKAIQVGLAAAAGVQAALLARGGAVVDPRAVYGPQGFEGVLGASWPAGALGRRGRGRGSRRRDRAQLDQALPELSGDAFADRACGGRPRADRRRAGADRRAPGRPSGRVPRRRARRAVGEVLDPLLRGAHPAPRPSGRARLRCDRRRVYGSARGWSESTSTRRCPSSVPC